MGVCGGSCISCMSSASLFTRITCLLLGSTPFIFRVGLWWTTLQYHIWGWGAFLHFERASKIALNFISYDMRRKWRNRYHWTSACLLRPLTKHPNPAFILVKTKSMAVCQWGSVSVRTLKKENAQAQNVDRGFEVNISHWKITQTLQALTHNK